MDIAVIASTIVSRIHARYTYRRNMLVWLSGLYHRWAIRRTLANTARAKLFFTGDAIVPKLIEESS